METNTKGTARGRGTLIRVRRLTKGRNVKFKIKARRMVIKSPLIKTRAAVSNTQRMRKKISRKRFSLWILSLFFSGENHALLDRFGLKFTGCFMEISATAPRPSPARGTISARGTGCAGV